MSLRTRLLAALAFVALAVVVGSSTDILTEGPISTSLLSPRAQHWGWRPGPTAPDAPIETELTWACEAGGSSSVTLTARVTPLVDGEELQLRWVIPSGATSVGPMTKTLGSAIAGERFTLQRDVNFSTTGSFRIAVDAQMHTSEPPAIYGDAAVLFFSVDAGGVVAAMHEHPVTHATVEQIETPNLRSAATEFPQSGYWVQGRFLYEDHPVSPSGPGAPVLVPARQVLVQIWEDDLVFDDHDGSTRTDDNGIFHFYVSNNDDGWFGGDKETYLKIIPNTPGGYVTDISWIDNDYVVETGNHTGGRDIDFGTMKPANFDPMFNIADVLLDAWRYAAQYRTPPSKAKARYEPGYGADGSYYDPFWNEITLGDVSSDPDGYDDTVIIHEYGHYIAHQHACDDSPGGYHELNKHYNDDLAWSEGWASYLSSAVRADSFYMDVNGAGGWGICVDWEAWNVTGATNEGAVTATLWDLYDPANETHDRMATYGHHVWYTFDELMEEQWYNDASRDCTIGVFWDEWVDYGFPDDSQLAAIFGHHGTGGTVTSAATIGDERQGGPHGEPGATEKVDDTPAYPPVAVSDGEGGTTSNASATVLDGAVPWQNVLFLIDTTGSMAAEIGAVRDIIQDKVVEMDSEPDPYEYIVESFQDTGVNILIADHFFPDTVNPFLPGITVSGGGDPAEDAFAALARGTAQRLGADAWLFTDGAPKQLVSVGQLEGLLQARGVAPYFFIFGDCSGVNAASDVVGEAVRIAHAAPPSPLRLPRFSAAGLEDCIEPYLLVAAGTGGEFLLTDESQLENAAEIVRAVMSNNAGAGCYADHVSSGWSYTWNNTRYQWLDATSGTLHRPSNSEYVEVPLYEGFGFYGSFYDTLYVTPAGYVTFSEPEGVIRNNTGIPTRDEPNNAVYGFWDDLSVHTVEAAETSVIGPAIYTAFVGDRYVVEYHQAYHRRAAAQHEWFEIIMDRESGTILLQYREVADDSSCTVGVENASGRRATQVIHNNPGALQDGRAILFTPVPPNPSKDYDVLVDETMESVVFLLNGYSGEVNLTVYRPEGGEPIGATDPGVTYLDVGRVQYYRLEKPESGTWTARASGDGSYTFTSSSSSELHADVLGDVTLPSTAESQIRVNLGIVVPEVAFEFLLRDGSHFDQLILFNDGEHGDGEPGDGIWAGPYTPPQPGTCYLKAEGSLRQGEPFVRMDPIPIRFQEMRLLPPAAARQFATPGSIKTHEFTLCNDATSPWGFTIEVDSDWGWAEAPSYDVLFVDAQSCTQIPIEVNVPAGAERVVERTTLTAGGMDQAVAETVVRGVAHSVHLEAHPDRVAPDGREASIVAFVGDDAGWNVADGTPVTFQTSLGSLNPPVSVTNEGIATTTLTSGAATGTAHVEATVGSAHDAIDVETSAAPAYTLTLEAAADQLPADGCSTTLLTASVYDKYGDPGPEGAQVVFGVEGDNGGSGQPGMGTVGGHEIYTATVSGGEAAAVYRSGSKGGVARVRAMISLEGDAAGPEGLAAERWAQTSILLVGQEHQVYLPLVLRNVP